MRLQILGKAIQQTAGKQHGRIHRPNMIPPQKCEFAAKRFDQTCGFLQAVFRWTIGWREPRDDGARNFGLWQAINQLVSQGDLLPLQLFIEQLNGCAWRYG